MSKVPTFAKAKDCSEQKEHLSELKEMPIPNGAANCLSGCTFVMTGTLPALTRAKAKKLIEDYGGNVSSSINKKTNVILKGYDEETSKKLQEAEKKVSQLLIKKVFLITLLVLIQIIIIIKFKKKMMMIMMMMHQNLINRTI